MKLISEFTETGLECIIEAKKDGSGKNYVIEGVFAQADQKNRNGRIYPRPIMEKRGKQIRHGTSYQEESSR